jgi:hypothetical protein
MSARVIQVIEVVVKRGCGITYCNDPRHVHQPIRDVTQFFSLDGELLAEQDPNIQAYSPDKEVR